MFTIHRHNSLDLPQCNRLQLLSILMGFNQHHSLQQNTLIHIDKLYRYWLCILLNRFQLQHQDFCNMLSYCIWMEFIFHMHSLLAKLQYNYSNMCYSNTIKLNHNMIKLNFHKCNLILLFHRLQHNFLAKQLYQYKSLYWNMSHLHINVNFDNWKYKVYFSYLEWSTILKQL